eukprot:5581688-Lingulodinium_polyedra.AAC.1
MHPTSMTASTLAAPSRPGRRSTRRRRSCRSSTTASFAMDSGSTWPAARRSSSYGWQEREPRRSEPSCSWRARWSSPRSTRAASASRSAG